MDNFFGLAARNPLYALSPPDRIAYTKAFGSPTVEQWLEQEKRKIGLQGGIDLMTYHTMSEYLSSVNLPMQPVYHSKKCCTHFKTGIKTVPEQCKFACAA